MIFRFQGLVFSGRLEKQKSACFTYTLIIMYSTSAGTRKYLDGTGKMLELQPILELRGAFFESQHVIKMWLIHLENYSSLDSPSG